jgi:hypothetical protein
MNNPQSTKAPHSVVETIRRQHKTRALRRLLNRVAPIPWARFVKRLYIVKMAQPNVLRCNEISVTFEAF